MPSLLSGWAPDRVLAVNVARPSALRYFGWLPESERHRFDAFGNAFCAELSCLLITKQAPSGLVYFYAAADIEGTGVERAFAGSVIASAAKVYRDVYADELYAGRSADGPPCWVGSGPVDGMLVRTVRTLPTLYLNKLRKRLRRSK